MVGLILNENVSPRGDMSAFSEQFAHEDYFMQQARTNGQEIAAPDPSAGVGNFLKFATKLINSKSVVEIGTGSGVGGFVGHRLAQLACAIQASVFRPAVRPPWQTIR